MVLGGPLLQKLLPPLLLPVERLSAVYPAVLHHAGISTRARDRQVPLLELGGDDLPAADHLLLVYRRDAPVVYGDVGELGQLAAQLDILGQLLRLRGLDEDREQGADGVGARELGIG